MSFDLLFTAEHRTSLRLRIILTEPSWVFGSEVAWPLRTDRAAHSASRLSFLPCRYRNWRLGRVTSSTVWPCARRCRERPAPYEPVPSIPNASTFPREVAQSSRAPYPLVFAGRSEERRVGKECVSTCRSRGWPYH